MVERMCINLMAYCGLNCAKCPAFKATQADDQMMRAKVAEEWSKLFNKTIDASDINCDGCLTAGRLFSHCAVCEVRKCGTERELENCGHCNEYPCSRLNFIFKAVPEVKAVLDHINSNR